MKVLLQKNVQNVGKIGDVVEVKAGYARNYLLPQGLAVHPNAVNLRAVEAAKQAYLEELAKIRTELEAKAAVVNGREGTISARANEEGHLYGSIGPAQISAALADQKGAALWAVSAADGKRLAELKLDSMPVWDGMAAARGRLYLATRSGKVLCFGPAW